MPQLLCRRLTLAVWALLLLLLLDQMSTGAVSPADKGHAAPGAMGLLRRFPRMTPLWRTLGTKPYMAYCQGNYECSTGICRNGHCSFNQPIQSYRTN